MSTVGQGESVIDEAKREQLVAQGFCIFPNVLPGAMLKRLRTVTDRMIEATTEELRQQTGGQGVLLGIGFEDPVFPELSSHPAAMEALRRLGFDRPRYWSGYIISKEAHSPPSYWHQDWPYWDAPESGEDVPHQLFLMYYLTDTRVENGCLRVIPESHRRHFPLHDLPGHDGSARHEDPWTSPCYADDPAQVNVPVQAGDLLVGDARALHAANGNGTPERRTVITLWYLPRYDEMSDALKCTFRRRLYFEPPKDLAPELLERIRPYLLDYEGDAEPVEWNRIPGVHLKR